MQKLLLKSLIGYDFFYATLAEFLLHNRLFFLSYGGIPPRAKSDDNSSITFIYHTKMSLINN